MEGVLYCNPHFEQLYKESGNFNKNFLSPAKSADQLTPGLTKSPSNAAGMFSGTQDKCATCGKTTYPLEKIVFWDWRTRKQVACLQESHMDDVTQKEDIDAGQPRKMPWTHGLNQFKLIPESFNCRASRACKNEEI